jgi:hypothetical protein
MQEEEALARQEEEALAPQGKAKDVVPKRADSVDMLAALKNKDDEIERLKRQVSEYQKLLIERKEQLNGAERVREAAGRGSAGSDVCSDASLKEKEQLCDKLGAAACKRARAAEKASSKSAADMAGAARAGEDNLGKDSIRITAHCGDGWNSELVTLDVMASDTIQTVKGKIRSNYAKIRRLPRGIELFVLTTNSTAHLCEDPVQDDLTLTACNVENLGQIWVFRAWVCCGTLCVCCDTLLHYAHRAYHISRIAYRIYTYSITHSVSQGDRAYHSAIEAWLCDNTQIVL